MIMFVFNSRDFEKSSCLIDFAMTILGQKNIQIGKTRLFSEIKNGHLFLDGRKQDSPRRPLKDGQVLEFSKEFLSRLETALEAPKFSSDWILYEDESLLAINKPAFLSSNQTHDLNSPSLEGMVKELKHNQYCEMVHRLDKGTSGVILFALNKEMAAILHGQFAQHSVQKTYHAITIKGPLKRRHDGSPDSPYSLKFESNLGRISKSTERAKYGTTETGKHSLTEAIVLGQSDNFFHLEIFPKTGRPHQIRVHLSEAGLPIVGDSLYGWEKSAHLPVPERTLLHAFQISFTHPKSGEKMNICAPFPDDFSHFLEVF